MAMAHMTHPAAYAPLMSERRRNGHIRNVFDIIGQL
jgi:hypothetical protein